MTRLAHATTTQVRTLARLTHAPLMFADPLESVTHEGVTYVAVGVRV